MTDGNVGKRTPRRPTPKKRPTDEVLRELVMAKGGIVTYVAQACGTNPRTVRRWRETNKKVNDMFIEARENVLDMAEAGIIGSIKKGNVASMIWVLKCFGRPRGWIERADVHLDVPGLSKAEIQEEVTFARRVVSDSTASRLACELLGRVALMDGKAPIVDIEGAAGVPE